MLEAYEAFKQNDGLYPATFEVIYGHAWRIDTLVHRQEEDGYVRIPADKIPLLNTY
jgi:malonyl-CoA O-methyltransferase